MHFWSITEIVYKPCAGRHLMFIVYSRFRLVVVYGQKVEIFVHFQMFITSSILELRGFWAQFWNSQDPLYRFPGTNKNNIIYKITIMGKIYPCVFSLCFTGSLLPSSQPVTCANIDAQFYFKNIIPPTPASKMIFGLLWFREKRFQVHMCTGYLVTDV